MSKEERKRGLMSLAGCWKDNPEDAARMESAIKEGRKNEFMREINLDDWWINTFLTHVMDWLFYSLRISGTSQAILRLIVNQTAPPFYEVEQVPGPAVFIHEKFRPASQQTQTKLKTKMKTDSINKS